MPRTRENQNPKPLKRIDTWAKRLAELMTLGLTEPCEADPDLALSKPLSADQAAKVLGLHRSKIREIMASPEWQPAIRRAATAAAHGLIPAAVMARREIIEDKEHKDRLKAVDGVLGLVQATSEAGETSATATLLKVIQSLAERPRAQPPEWLGRVYSIEDMRPAAPE